MSDMGTTLGQPIARKDFVDLVANLDSDGLRAFDASVYQAQIK